MNTHRTLLSLSTAFLVGLAFCAIAPAAITTTGDVTPDPATTTPTDDLYVGDKRDGSMTIDAGSGVTNDDCYVGNGKNSESTVMVTGTGSTWNSSSYVHIGVDGIGTVNVQNGAAWTLGGAYLGYNEGASGSATLNDATWNNAGQLYVGYSGNGTVSIENGAELVSDHCSIGDIQTGIGAMTVTGPGTTWTDTFLVTVGNYGAGTLNIENGAVVSSDTVFIAAGGDTTGSATVNGSGSEWKDIVFLEVGVSSDGTLNIEDGGVVSSIFANLGDGPAATGTVSVTGAGSTWNNSSTLGVGDQGTGILNIQNGGAVAIGGDISIYSLSTLDILLASTSDPLLDLAGNASLDGTLNVALAGGFALNAGDMFTLIELTDISKTITGTFIGLAEGDSVGNFGGLELFISYVGGDGNDVTLFSPLLPGDIDRDGFVSETDLNIVIDNWGQSLGREFGDLNGNGVVDGPDYSEVLSYWNPPGEPTPEPATLALLLAGGLALLNRRHKSS